MRLLFWRRKPKHEGAAVTAASLVASSAASTLKPTPSAPVAAVPRKDPGEIATRPLVPSRNVHDAVLSFAVETLRTSRAKVSIEAEDRISATFPDGTIARYTTTLAVAREDEAVRLLVQGGAALSELVDMSMGKAAFGALVLTPHPEPAGIARAGLAEPLPECGRCATAGSGGAVDACERCPLRVGRVVLRGSGKLAGGSIARQWEAWSADLAYEVAYSDRQGRRTEWVRLAFDLATGAACATLDRETLQRAEATPPPPHRAQSVQELESLAERTLAPQLHAGAAFLRLRSERDFRNRLADLESTANRLARETPADEQQITESLAAEIERLREVFAVDVEARLRSICFVRSPLAEVVFDRRDGLVTLTVDLGRGVLLPPSCAACGQPVNPGRVCERGHMTCAVCATLGDDAVPCAPCAAGGEQEPLKARPKRKGRASAAAPGDDALQVALVREMSDETWLELVGWLAEHEGIRHEGIRLERGDEHGKLVLWHGQEAAVDAPAAMAALRLPPQLLLSGDDVRRTAAAAGTAPGVRMRLFSTAPASDAARSEAQRLDVELIDADALTRRLAAVEATVATDREMERAAAAEVAASAARARDTMLASLGALEETLSRVANRHRASGRAAVAAAMETTAAARQEALRAFLAWNTLAGEWMTSFDERAGRDGGLVMLADERQFVEMDERASHLYAATTRALERVVSAPATGELGYSAWRKAIVEELTSHCESSRWRLLGLDPAHWSDFTGAHDTLALERASGAEAAAAHAAARVAKAYSVLIARVRP